MTPMMKQYTAIRTSLPDDVILFYRLGDFYEIFQEDANITAPLIGIALTKRNGMPMCGVPHHAAEGYIGKLIKAGKRVAIAEQTSEPRPGQIVEREVTQIISAGTVSDINLLDQNKCNYLAALYYTKKRFGLAFADHTTGEFRLAEFDNLTALEDELQRVGPSEVIYSDEQVEKFSGVGDNAFSYDGYAFLDEQANFTLKEHFKVQSLHGFGCSEMPAAIGAAGALFHYLKSQLRRSVDHIKRLQTYQPEQFVLIDPASARNLDLVEHRSGSKHTLLHALDRTATPMGARKIRHWILHPLRDLAELEQRQELIAALLDEPFILNQIQESLKDVRDIERTSSRLSQGSGNARDLQSLCKSLLRVPEIRSHLSTLSDNQLIGGLTPRLRDFRELVELLDKALAEEPPAGIKDGGIFQDGYNANLDELRAASSEGKRWIADLQAREAERSGIKNLKVKFNNVFGYFIEITKSNLANVPENYTRKQTMTNAERYITPELKEVENKILGADERAKTLEYEEFLTLRESVLEHLADLQDTADALATLDVLCGLAEVARLFNYCRPLLNHSHNLYLKGARHPVLDQNIGEEKFVPNDTYLENEENRLLLITGPNMAGKSTYIRQVALLSLMAQIGSYVPAESAEIGLVDRIFTRVGASDDLAQGQSTFMVEMNETALIINNATDRSLVILDEIGRGTATFDGLSIAWSVAEHLHDHIGCRTLFATHYHELTDLSKSRTAVQNYNIAVREWNDQIIFLRKIVPGTADKSYGIQVARLAGLPNEIIQRAKEILDHLEKNNTARPKKGTTRSATAATAAAADSSVEATPKPEPKKKKQPRKSETRSKDAGTTPKEPPAEPTPNSDPMPESQSPQL
ncbi:MAG: DNA mismatch repair protein MutS, partial [Verrucomicrobiales bacterium]